MCDNIEQVLSGLFGLQSSIYEVVYIGVCSEPFDDFVGLISQGRRSPLHPAPDAIMPSDTVLDVMILAGGQTVLPPLD